MRLEPSTGEAQLGTAGQATFGMTNLRPDPMGLPFTVFISQRDDARHAARVKSSPRPRAERDALGSHSSSPSEHRADPRACEQARVLELECVSNSMTHSGPEGCDETALERWVGLNRDVLQAYWDGDIEYTRDALERLKRA